MGDSRQLPAGGEGYRRILAASPTDARLYLWTERLVMIAGIGTVITLGLAIVLPLAELLRGTWRGIDHYLGGILILPLPFLILMFAGARLHRRVARRHGLLDR